MNSINLETCKEIRPMIYAYNTPSDHNHDGWTTQAKLPHQA